MKQLILALLLLSQAGKATAQAENDLSAEGLSGRVKVVMEIQYTDEARKRPFMKTVDKYDGRGNLTEEQHTDLILKLKFRGYMKYDTSGDGRVIVRKEFNDSGLVIRSITYTYDSQGHVVASADSRTFGNKRTVRNGEYYFDSSGKKVEERIYDGHVPERYGIYYYDGKGRVSAVKWYDSSAKVILRDDYNYLSGDLWVHCEKQSGAVRTHIFRIVDSAGIIVEKTAYSGDYSKHTTESYSNFDRNGNWRNLSVKGNMTENYFVARAIEYYK